MLTQLTFILIFALFYTALLVDVISSVQHVTTPAYNSSFKFRMAQVILLLSQIT